jgi:GNAT superfamily N-acetyltransferase
MISSRCSCTKLLKLAVSSLISGRSLWLTSSVRCMYGSNPRNADRASPPDRGECARSLGVLAGRAPPRVHPSSVRQRTTGCALDDLSAILPRVRALNSQEDIAIDDAELEAALRRLLAEPSLGGVWLVERDGRPIGHAVVTYGYDLEFGGRDAYLTELWVDEPERGKGAGAATLAALDRELRDRDVRALHLGVRPENPAVRLYERAGFAHVPRVFMTKRM